MPFLIFFCLIYSSFFFKEDIVFKKNMLTKQVFLKTMESIFFPIPINCFPANLPVSLSKELLPSLLFGYVGTLKADGERELLWIDGTNLYAINRNLRIWHITSELPPLKVRWVLLDTEYVNKEIFYSFDMLVYDGKNICDWDIYERLHFLQIFLHEHSLPFIQPKPYYNVFDILDIYSQPHTLPIDGILFVRRLASYQPFRVESNNILKWKPIVTLDFLVRNQDGGVELLCLHNHEYKVFATEIWPDFNLDNVIAECKLEQGHWIFMKTRLDKDKPNTLEVVESSIKNMDVTFNDLKQLFS